jgi:hypothetical protein
LRRPILDLRRPILDLREPYRRTIAVGLRLRLYLRHLHLRLRLYLRRNPCFLQFFGPPIKSLWKGVHYNREILSPRTDQHDQPH